ncbi:MAG TPA: methyltransferase domain-containing protein [Phycicoccus sp.]
MAGCCDSRGCDGVFGDRFARRLAKRYRRRGLGRTERRIVDGLVARGVDGATVLEIGGGVGELQLELLRAGAARATNLELVDVYDEHARALAAEAGLADRVERRIIDVAADPQEVDPADVVVLHRVVCCYPDAERLLAAAADHTNRLLVFSHPPRHVVTRVLLVLQNAWLRVTGKAYRAFLHPPELMLEVLQRHGLRVVDTHHGIAWHVVVLNRP